MSFSRSRVVRSSSQGEIGLFNHTLPIESPVSFSEKKGPAPITTSKTVKEYSQPPVSAEKQQTRHCIFTLGSPERENNDARPKNKKPDNGFGEFLKACFLCKKKLLQDKDIYLYGHLGAFCSPECREYRMDLDGFDQEIAKETSARLETALGGKFYTKEVRKLGFRC
ncbi:uncharacterized protein LOC131179097 [Hevea brasiliensis]|uniref:uncharacterized protein LOC131179097 n=1 Tax=Hevea brasiliensis TaxID=3981 RepID=UPI0025F7AF20|nr:uncharacterized protein LOC131179097 [Hevea brasiliensis]